MKRADFITFWRPIKNILSQSPNAEEEMMAVESSQAAAAPPSYATDELTELGKCLIRHEVRVAKEMSGGGGVFVAL